MKSNYILLAVCFLLSIGLKAQHPSCASDNSRYFTSVFSDVDITNNIKYGESTTLAGNQKELLFDMYQPNGDTASIRPFVIMVHGGSFLTGNKEQVAPLCKGLAQIGYVSASVNYRLVDSYTAVTDSITFGKAVLMAVNDLRAAVRFFKHSAANENPYKIDTNHIYVGGISAGAIMANHVGYLDTADYVPPYLDSVMNLLGGFEGNSNTIGGNSSINGVLNLSGSLIRSYWIDANDPPLFSVHEEYDSIVPCNYATTKATGINFPAYSFGSCLMDAVADSVGIKNEFILFPDSSHVGYFPTKATQIIDSIGHFLGNIICESTVPNSDLRIISEKPKLVPNPNNGEFKIEITDLHQYKIMITDVLGRQVFFGKNIYSGTPIRILNNNLPNGIYYLSIYNDEVRFKTQVVTINN